MPCRKNQNKIDRTKLRKALKKEKKQEGLHKCTTTPTMEKNLKIGERRTILKSHQLKAYLGGKICTNLNRRA